MDNHVLVMIDVQKEYNTVGRPFYINGIEESLRNAKAVLEFARKHNWHIIHIKHEKDGPLFARGTEYVEYIDGFAPAASEKEFIKNNYSSFSNEDFAQELKKYKTAQIFIAGYNSTMCVLSTIIEGYHQGYSLHFIYDASGAKTDGITPEQERHCIMTSVLSSFANIIPSKDVCKLNA